MKSASAALRQATFNKLHTQVSYNGSNVPVFGVVPSSAVAPYIWITSITAAEAESGKKDCSLQDCTVLVEVITRSKPVGASYIPVDTISAKVVELITQGLQDSADFQFFTPTLDSENNLQENTDTDIILRKLLRFRIQTYQLTY
jgi:hypothetical protein